MHAFVSINDRVVVVDTQNDARARANDQMAQAWRMTMRANNNRFSILLKCQTDEMRLNWKSAFEIGYTSITEISDTLFPISYHHLVDYDIHTHTIFRSSVWRTLPGTCTFFRFMTLTLPLTRIKSFVRWMVRGSSFDRWKMDSVDRISGRWRNGWRLAMHVGVDGTWVMLQ